MIYLFETEINNNKPLSFSLQQIYGIGKFQAFILCKKLGVSKNFLTANLSKEQIFNLLKLIENSNLILANKLKTRQILLLRKLVDMKSYSGLRKIRGLPIKGQRTHTNAKTSKRFKNFLK